MLRQRLTKRASRRVGDCDGDARSRDGVRVLAADGRGDVRRQCAARVRPTTAAALPARAGTYLKKCCRRTSFVRRSSASFPSPAAIVLAIGTYLVVDHSSAPRSGSEQFKARWVAQKQLKVPTAVCVVSRFAELASKSRRRRERGTGVLVSFCVWDAKSRETLTWSRRSGRFAALRTRPGRQKARDRRAATQRPGAETPRPADVPAHVS